MIFLDMNNLFTEELNLSIPCEIIAKFVKELRKICEQCRKYQRHFVEKAGLPATIMLDLQNCPQSSFCIIN